MADAVDGIQALNSRIVRNVVYEGSGRDAVVVLACPFCGAPGWLRMSMSVPPVDGGPGECHCSECWRTGRLDVIRGAGVVTFELVLTGGPPLPDWYQPLPRLEGAAAEAARLREPGYSYPVRVSRAEAYAVAVVQVPRSCPIWDDAAAAAGG